MNCYRTVHIHFAGQNILWEQINILTIHFFDIQSFSIKKSNFKTWLIYEIFEGAYVSISLNVTSNSIHNAMTNKRKTII